MDENGIKAILFDLDNTLIDTAGAGRRALEKVGEFLQSKCLHPDAIGAVCEGFLQKLRCEQLEPSRERSVDQVRVGHWASCLRQVDGEHTLAADCYWLWKRTRLDLLLLPAPVRLLLGQLSGSYKLLLLTNGDTQTQREKVRQAECEGLFTCVVVGGEHGEQKPHPSIFYHCFQLLGVEPNQCVMVGDSLDTDILGGKNAGVHATVWISPNAVTAEQSIKPDYIIPSVLDLPSVLCQLQQV